MMIFLRSEDWAKERREEKPKRAASKGRLRGDVRGIFMGMAKDSIVFPATDTANPYLCRSCRYPYGKLESAKGKSSSDGKVWRCGKSRVFATWYLDAIEVFVPELPLGRSGCFVGSPGEQTIRLAPRNHP